MIKDDETSLVEETVRNSLQEIGGNGDSQVEAWFDHASADWIFFRVERGGQKFNMLERVIPEGFSAMMEGRRAMQTFIARFIRNQIKREKQTP